MKFSIRTAVLGLIILFISYAVYQYPSFQFDADISHVIPLSEKDKGAVSRLNDMEVFDRYTVLVSVKDTNDLTVAQDAVQEICDSLNVYSDSLYEYVQYTVDDSKIDELYQLSYQALPYYLDHNDYLRIDSMIQQERSANIMNAQYQMMLTPAGFFVKKYFVQDPLGFTNIILKKMAKGIDQDISLNNGYFVSENKKTVLFFVKPKALKNDYEFNKTIYSHLQQTINQASEKVSVKLETHVYGGALIAFQNSDQVKADMLLTVGITIVFIVLLVLLAYRNIWSPIVLITPVILSALSAVVFIYYFSGSLSGIALGAGSVVLGIAIDFCIHYYGHYLEEGSLEQTHKDVFFPLFMGCLTTSGAFFSLLFTDSSLLQDLGLFAGVSLLFAFLYTVVLVPFLIQIFKIKPSQKNASINAILAKNVRINRWGALGLVSMTVFLTYKSFDVQFESDLSNLVYKSTEVDVAEKKVNEVTKGLTKYVYFLLNEDSSSSANHKASLLAEQLNVVSAKVPVTGISSLLISELEAEKKWNTWTHFWASNQRQQMFQKHVQANAQQLGLKPEVFHSITSTFIQREQIDSDSLNANVIKVFLADYNKNSKDVIVPFKVDAEHKSELIKSFDKQEHIAVIDRQTLFNKISEIVNQDFQFVLTVSSLLVLVVLFHMFGRIELAFITFVPMIISWVWILGIMGIAGIHFNLVNIILCTFIFGLGDDYSIFMTEAKVGELKYGKSNIGVYRFSILLSCLTTIAGMAALFWAKHPAIYSIAFISVVGILCVTIVSYFIIPAFIEFFVLSRTRKGKYPLTFVDIAKSFYLYSIFLVGAFFVNVVVLVLRLLFLKNVKAVRYFVNYLIMYSTKGIVYSIFFMRKDFQLLSKKQLTEPSIIIANHRSFIDIVITTMLQPKIVLVAADWVWKSPIMGQVLDFGGYIKASMPPEEQLVLIKQRLAEGYSIVVFPEGTRNTEEGMKRFHKGAFYLAQECGAPIIPMVIHGSGDCITKGDDFVVKSGLVTIRTLDTVYFSDTQFGMTYQEKSKLLRKHMLQTYEGLQSKIENTAYYKSRLLKNYQYRGPVIEWYLFVKIMIENNYETFHQLVPKSGQVLDLGCGYGFLPYMLKLTSSQRTIEAVDYDEEKIKVAQNAVLKDDRIEFAYADVTTYNFTKKYDAIIISDVLHYFSEEKQRALVDKCIKHLNYRGVLIIRDADVQENNKQWVTNLSEIFSSKILKFNKTVNRNMEFVSLVKILSDISSLYNVSLEKVSVQKNTSNVIYKITSHEQHGA